MSLTENDIQELLRRADDAGLLDEEIDYGDPRVSDLPTTTMTFTVGGRTVAQSAYALGVGDDTVTVLNDSERAARAVLTDFIDTAESLVGAESEQYAPAGVLAYRFGTEEAPPVEDPALEQDPVPWPIATVPPPTTTASASGSCVAVTGAEVATLLAALGGANELTPWLIATEPPVRMTFRPLLPGDPGCP